METNVDYFDYRDEILTRNGKKSTDQALVRLLFQNELTSLKAEFDNLSQMKDEIIYKIFQLSNDEIDLIKSKIQTNFILDISDET